MEKIIRKFQEKCEIISDINEHLPTLKRYGQECETIVEMGVRSLVSTWAFMASNPKKLISLDLEHPSVFGGDLDEVYLNAYENGITFEFVQSSSLDYNMPYCDLLFIDTWHDYLQLKKELVRHHKNVGKYIILHDTNTFGYIDELFYENPDLVRPETNLPKGLCPAINEFLNENCNWGLWERTPKNNGLSVLKRL
jgi:hypothetical protein